MSAKGSERRPEVPGPESRRLHAEEQHYLAPGVQSIALVSGIALERGEGPYLIDVDGNRYIDFFAGVSVASLGHAHPRYVAALKRQLERLHVGSFTTPDRVELVKLIASVAPGDLCRTQLFSSGAEAVEAALRLAKAHTRKFEVVGFWGGFHGKTLGAMGVMGDDFKVDQGPLPPGSYLSTYGYCYRCPFHLTYPSCGLLCAEWLDKVIRHQTTGQVAAVIVEPIQGTAGNIVPPPGFLSAVREIAARHGTLFIADEIISGFGRTGKMFACEHEGVVPDIMTVGKGLGGGFPVSGLISTDAITAARPFSLPSASSSSFGGNPLAATAALVTLRTILEEGLVEHAEKLGRHMLERLRPMQARFEFVGEVRGKGLMIGIELVRDKRTREPLDAPVAQAVFQEALRRGLIIMVSDSRIRINPALTMTEEVAEQGIGLLEECFAHIAAHVPYR